MKGLEKVVPALKSMQFFYSLFGRDKYRSTTCTQRLTTMRGVGVEDEVVKAMLKEDILKCMNRSEQIKPLIASHNEGR